MVASMKDLIAGKGKQDQVQADGVTLPVGPLQSLVDEGYEYMRYFKDNDQVAFWGKTCSACYTSDRIREMS